MKKNLFLTLFLAIATITYAQDKVFAPSLIAPADNATEQMANALLNWGAVAGAQKYQVQYATDDLFTAPTSLITMFTAIYANDLHYFTDYYWRVRAIGAPGDTSAWSVIRIFTVKEKPVLTAPLNGLTQFHLQPKVQWEPLTGSSFHIQYDTLSDFSSPFATVVTETGDFTTLNIGLYGADFFFRVRAFHAADTSDWSDTITISTRGELPIKIPANNIMNALPIVQLEFKGVVGSELYQYQYSIFSDFSNATIVDIPVTPQTQVISAGTNPDTIVRVLYADTLPYGEAVYWRARAISNIDTSIWSVDPFIINVIGDVQSLYAPAASAVNVSTKPQFKWKRIRGSMGYELEYSTDPMFAVDVTSVEVDETTSNVDTISYTVPHSEALDLVTQYFWRVRAFNNRSVSNWLDSDFTTGNSASIDDFNLSGALSIYPNPSRGIVNVQLHTSGHAEYVIQINNLIGQTVMSRSGSLNSGKNIVSFNLEQLNNGIYFISVQVDKQSVMHKIILDK
jgi:hypothetical protein